MDVIKVLMVEDRDEQQSLYSDAVEEFNEEEQEISIQVEYVKSAKEAEEKLNENEFDALFLDLRLEGDGNRSSNEASGNDVLKHLIEEGGQRLIISVISATPQDINPDYDELFESPLLNKFSRDDDTKEVLRNLVSTWKTGITKILGREGRLNSLVNDIFFKHISKGFKFWVERDADCENELLRYTALHLLEYLDLPENLDDGESGELSYHAPEFYIIPPINKSAATGLIISYDDKKYVVLSPSCDLAPRGTYDSGDGVQKTIYNVELVVLAEIVSLEKSIFDELDIPISSKGKRRNSDWRSFYDKVKGNNKQRYHYLPSYLSMNEGVVDFKRIRYIPINDLMSAAEENKVGAITRPFLSDIQSRFSAYFARQGQPIGSW
jgi:CheY-like chemotaxis protein